MLGSKEKTGRARKTCEGTGLPLPLRASLALSLFGAHYFQAPATQTKVEPLALTAAILVILFRCSSVRLYSSSTQQVNIILYSL